MRRLRHMGASDYVYFIIGVALLCLYLNGVNNP